MKQLLKDVTRNKIENIDLTSKVQRSFNKLFVPKFYRLPKLYKPNISS